MNKKAFSLAVILSMATTGAFASDVVSTSVNNGDKLTKLQKEAIQLTQQQLAQKASQDAQQYEAALNLNEDSTVSLALANNRTAKQTLWDYQAAKATVSATAAGKNPNVSYTWQGARNHGANTMTGGTVTSKTGQHSFTIKAPVFSPELDANIDKSRFAREGSGAAYEEALQQAKYDAINGYYTLIMYRNKVDVANQAVKDYQGHVDNVKAQYNVGLVANSDVLAADTNLADSQTNLVKAQNAANLAEANLNLVIAYPAQTSITTAENDLQYKPYAVTLEQAKAYAMLHRSALVQSAMAVKQAEEALKAEKLVSMTDIAGLLRDRFDESTLISQVTRKEVEALTQAGAIAGGMIPKIACCTEFLQAGGEEASIIDGRVDHAILIELLCSVAHGTRFIP